MSEANKSEHKQLKVDFSSALGIAPAYANQVLIQHTSSEYIFTFFEVLPPPLPSAGEGISLPSGVDSVPAKPVARIVMTMPGAFALLDALRTNIDHLVQEEGDEEEG